MRWSLNWLKGRLWALIIVRIVCQVLIGYMECHIENDLLLIWLDETADVMKLVRFGSHSELF